MPNNHSRRRQGPGLSGVCIPSRPLRDSQYSFQPTASVFFFPKSFSRLLLGRKEKKNQTRGSLDT